MTRLDLLKIVISRARANGFEYRRWYVGKLRLPWSSPSASLHTLQSHRLYYALLFSHEFAEAFWKAGEEISFQVTAQTFQRTMPDGSIKTVTRKPFTRRSARRDAWKYHLREMALAEYPLRYIRKYLNVEEDLEDTPEPILEDIPDDPTPRPRPTSAAKKIAAPAKPKKRTPRPLPKDLPAFLKRPYPPR